MAKTHAQKAAEAEAKRKNNIDRETARIAKEAQEAEALDAAIEENRRVQALAAATAAPTQASAHRTSYSSILSTID